MERLFVSIYNEKLKKLKIDEIEASKNEDSLTKEIYNIAINGLPENIDNFSEEEIEENIELNKKPLALLLSSSINSNNLSEINSLSQSSVSLNSDKTSTSSEFNYINNDYIICLESSENNKKKIDLTNIITGEDKRTMIEINKIPKKYNINKLKEELNNKGFKGKYDYISFEINDRYNNDNIINKIYKKVCINFVEPLHIIIFLYLYQQKYFNFKGNLNDIQYSDYLPKTKISLDSKNNFKYSYNNSFRNSINKMSKIEIPAEYLDFYKKVNPNDVCINIKDSYFGINTFIVKKNNNKK